MEILFIGTLEPFPGGSGTVNTLLVRGLAQRGHRITAVSPLGPLAGSSMATPSGDDDEARFPGVQVHRYAVPYAEIEPQHTGADFVAIERARIASTLELHRPTVPDVIFVGRETFARYVPEALPWPDRPPIVVSAHSSHASGLLIDESPSATALELLAHLRACQRLVLVAEHPRRFWSVLDVPISVIPNAVDLDVFTPGRQPRQGSPSESDVVVIHISNLKTVKRPLDLVAAAALALRREPSLFFVVAGDGLHGQQMRQAARAAGIAERFNFAGWQPRSRLPGLVQQADIAVLMSEREAMPCALLEGMASGLPSVASDIPATREVVLHGETGFTYPVGDVERLAEILVDLARDPETRQRVGAAARRAVEGRGVEAFIDQYEDVLRSVIAESAPDAGATAVANAP